MKRPAPQSMKVRLESSFFSFWWLCTRNAFWGNTAFANDWQWVFGIPVISGLLAWANAQFGAAAVSTGSPIGDGFLAALGAFIITWLVAFIVRFLNAPVALYDHEHKKADELAEQLRPRLTVVYDKTIRPCMDVVTYRDGVNGVCFRLQVTNVSVGTLQNCEGWLTKIEQMPQLGPVKLFWIGMPAERMSEELPQKVPRYLQICEILDSNRIIMATEGRLWPLGESNIFKPGEYDFQIVINASGVQAAEYNLKLTWTGNWKTAEINPQK